MVSGAGSDFSAGFEQFFYESFADAVSATGDDYDFVLEIGGHGLRIWRKPTLIIAKC